MLQISRITFLPAAFAVSLFFVPLLAAQEVSRITLPDAPIPQIRTIAADDPDEQMSSSQQDQASPQAVPQTGPPAAPQASNPEVPMTDAERKKASEDQLQQELQKRIAGVVPNFNAVLSGTALPLSGSQKVRASFRGTIDPY